jgi:hypothetical protein
LQRRQQFEESEAQRKAAFDRERIATSRGLRLKSAEMTGAQRREAIKADRDAQKEQAKLDIDKPIVDDNLIAQYPDIPGLPRLKGSRVDRDFLTKFTVEEPGREADRQRRASADARAEATNQRAADAAERAARALLGTSEGRLVDDYRVDKNVIAYQNVRSNIQTAQVAAKQRNGTGDVALIFSYMRALEPDNPNVVREGDFKVARLAAGQLQKLRSLPARFFSGDLLTDDGRQYFLKQMNESLQARKPAFESANTRFKRRASQQGITPENVITEYRDTPGGLGSDRDFGKYVRP